MGEEERRWERRREAEGEAGRRVGGWGWEVGLRLEMDLVERERRKSEERAAAVAGGGRRVFWGFRCLEEEEKGWSLGVLWGRGG